MTYGSLVDRGCVQILGLTNHVIVYEVFCDQRSSRSASMVSIGYMGLATGL